MSHSEEKEADGNELTADAFIPSFDRLQFAAQLLLVVAGDRERAVRRANTKGQRKVIEPLIGSQFARERRQRPSQLELPCTIMMMMVSRDRPTYLPFIFEHVVAVTGSSNITHFDHSLILCFIWSCDSSKNGSRKGEHKEHS